MAKCSWPVQHAVLRLLSRLLPTVPPTQPYHLQAADGQADALRAELQGQLQWLVANYSTRRASLLEEILPEVRRGGLQGCLSGIWSSAAPRRLLACRTLNASCCSGQALPTPAACSQHAARAPKSPRLCCSSPVCSPRRSRRNLTWRGVLLLLLPLPAAGSAAAVYWPAAVAAGAGAAAAAVLAAAAGRSHCCTCCAPCCRCCPSSLHAATFSTARGSR